MAGRSKKALQQSARLRQARKAALDEQFPGVHPNALTKVRPGAKFVSRGRKEYYITQADEFYVVRIYNGGKLGKSIDGRFTRYSDCERALINYLKATDKFNKAIYPGCREQQPIDSTETSQRD